MLSVWAYCQLCGLRHLLSGSVLVSTSFGSFVTSVVLFQSFFSFSFFFFFRPSSIERFFFLALFFFALRRAAFSFGGETERRGRKCREGTVRKEEGGSIKGLKKGYQQYKVPGEIKRSGDLEEGGGAGPSS